MRLDIPQVLARDVFRSAGGRQAAMLLGAHESVAGGLDKAFAHADAHQAEAIQIFTKNANQWKEPVLGGTELAGFRAAHRAFGGRPVIAHDSYLVNLCAERTDILERSREALFSEMLRCQALGVDFIAFHPGARVGTSLDDALCLVGDSLASILERSKGMRTR